MPTIRKAHVIGERHIVESLPTAAFRVASWDNAHSPATQRTVDALAKARGWITERVFDAAHGRRYVLFIYPPMNGQLNGPARRNCFDTLAAS